MSQRVFLMLGLVVLLMLCLVVVFSINTKDVSASKLLFPELKEKAKDLHRLDIITPIETTTILRNSEEWIVSQRDSYPAQREKLSKMLQQLTGLILKEKKTSKEQNYVMLGVSDQNAIRIDLYAGEQVFTALFGKSSSGREGRFVRVGSQVWLSDEIQILEKTTDWLEPVIIDVDPEDVARVEMNPLIFKRNDEGDFYVNNVPGDRELKYPSIPEEPARALTKLSLEDVKRHSPKHWVDARRASFFTKTGTEVQVLSVRRDESNWLHLRLLQNSEMGVDNLLGDLGGDNGDVPEKNIYSTHVRLRDWDFKVSDYVFDDFELGLDDILKDKPESN